MEDIRLKVLPVQDLWVYCQHKEDKRSSSKFDFDKTVWWVLDTCF